MVASVISKGLKVFEEAPPQVKRQIEEGDEQGIKYLEGRGIKKQEIAQAQEYATYNSKLQELNESTERARALDIPDYADDVARMNKLIAEDLVPPKGVLGEDPYKATSKGRAFKDITPPDVDKQTYNVVTYDLPKGLLTEEAKNTSDHFGGHSTAHVRRDVKNGALRIFEIQSDMQNQLTTGVRDDIPSPDIQFDVWLDSVDYNDTPFSEADIIDAFNQWNRQDDSELLTRVRNYFDENYLELPSSSKTKMSEYNIKWDDDVINRQFVDAANSGLDKVDFLITPAGDYMARSAQVQKNYEERIAKKVERLAKKLKGPNGEKATVEWIREDNTYSALADKKVQDTLVKLADNEEFWDTVDTSNYPLTRSFEDLVRQGFTIDQAALLRDWLQLVEGPSDILQVLNNALKSIKASKATSDKYLRVKLPVTAGGAVAAFSVPTFAQETEESKDTRIKQGVQKAVESGYTPVEIRKFLAEKQVDQDKQTDLLLKAYAPKIQQARESGYSDEEVTSFLRSKGVLTMSRPDVNFDEVLGQQRPSQNNLMTETTGAQDQASLVQREAPVDQLDPNAEPVEGEAQAQLAKEQQLRDIQQTVLPKEMLPKIDSVVNIQNEETANEVYAKLNNVHQRSKQLVYQVGSLTGNEEAKAELESLNTETTQLVAKGMTDLGYEVTNIDGTDIYIKNPQTGEEVLLDESILDSIENSSGEIAGAYVGYKLATTFAAKALAGYRPGHPLLSAGGMIVAGLAGSGSGAALGRGFDITRNALETQTKIEQARLIEEMRDAGLLDVALGAGVDALVQTVKITGKATKVSIRGLKRAKDLFIGGNKEGALRALVDNFNMSDDEAIELITKWEKLNGVKLLTEEARRTGTLGAKDSTAVLQVLSETTPGAESIVQAAAQKSKYAGSKLSATIANRARDLNKQIDSITNPNVATVVREQLDQYVKRAGDYYANTKALGSELMKESDYRFNFDTTTMIDVLKKQARGIHDGNLRKDFYSYIDEFRRIGGLDAIRNIQDQAKQFEQAKGLKNVVPKINSKMIEANNPARTFDDLLALREKVNALSSDSRFKQYIDFEQIRTIKNGIDNEIAKVANEIMPEGDAWLRQWKAANTEYSKMKDLETNSLYKLITKGEATSTEVTARTAKRLNAISPEAYMQVMGKLPVNTRKAVEGAVLQQITGKHTVGFEGGKQAVSFWRLSKELEAYTFTTKEARDLKRAIAEYAEVYKNDPHLLVATGNMPLPKFQSYLATDPMSRIKMETLSMTFNAVKSRIPFSNNAGRAAVLENLKKVLDNPKDAVSVEKILKALPDDPQLKTKLHELAIQYAKFGMPEKYGKAPVYRVAAPGAKNKASDTSLGRGILYYADKDKAKQVADQLGYKMEEDWLTYKAIATPDDVARILGRDPLPSDFKDPEVIMKVQESGKLGIAVDDKVVVFK